MNETEDEKHFFIYCKLYQKEREELFHYISNVIKCDFWLLDDVLKMKWLLSCNQFAVEHEIVIAVEKYIQRSHSKRTWKLCKKTR